MRSTSNPEFRSLRQASERFISNRNRGGLNSYYLIHIIMNTRKYFGLRKWLSLVAILSILSSLVAVIPVASAYSGADLPASLSYAKDAVDAACDAGWITCELPDPQFTSTVNRAVGYELLTRAFDLKVDTAKSPFKDVGGDWSWAAPAANSAFTLGWTNGVAADKFAPANTFTREQMAKAVASVLGLQDGSKADLAPYSDKAQVD